MTLSESLWRSTRPVDVGDPNPPNQSLASRGLTSTIGLVSQGFSRVLTNLIIGRIGGPAALGTVASALSVAYIAVLVWPASMGSAAAKFIPQARGRGDFIEAAAVAAHLKRRTLVVGALLAATVAPLWTLTSGGTGGAALVVALLIIALSAQALGSGIQYGTGHFTRAMHWDMLTSFLGVAGVTALLLLGHEGLSLLVPLGLAAGLYAVGCWPWSAQGKLPKAKRRELDLFVGVTTIGTLSSAGFHQLSVLASHAVAGVQGAGQYAAALALATPLLIGTSALSVVLFPSLAEATGREDHDSVGRQTDLATRGLVVALTAIVGVLVLSSRSITLVIWGPDFGEASHLLPIVLAAVLATGVAVPSVNYLANRSQRGATFGTAASVLGLVVGIAVWIALVPAWGLAGVAAGYLIGKVVFLVIVLVTASRRLSLKFETVLLKLTLTAIAVAGCVTYQFTHETPLWSDGLAGAGFLAGWCVVCRHDLRLAVAGFGSRRSS